MKKEITAVDSKYFEVDIIHKYIKSEWWSLKLKTLKILKNGGKPMLMALNPLSPC